MSDGTKSILSSILNIDLSLNEELSDLYNEISNEINSVYFYTIVQELNEYPSIKKLVQYEKDHRDVNLEILYQVSSQ